ncbi:hypothetical protein P9112_005300 [Eukaryota sp. TZLM1-RC]
MRLRLGLFPSELLDNSVCCCVKRPKADFKHIVSCKKFLQFRSILHNSVRDVTYEMFRCHGVNGKIEPLLKHYSDNDIFNCRRGDLIVPFTNSSQAVVDFTTVDPCAEVYLSSVFNDQNSHLCQAEARKNQLYDEVMRNLDQNLYTSFVFIPFAISIFGSIGKIGQKFFDSFAKLWLERNRLFNISIWRNRIIFALFRSFPKYLSQIFKKLYRSVRVDVENFSSYKF